MNHLYFGLYLLSLGIGIVTVSALANNPRYRFSPGFIDILYIYLLVTLCIAVTAAWLYIYINVATNLTILNTIYLCFILFFLALVPAFTSRAHAIQYSYTPHFWTRTTLRIGMAYSAVAAIACAFSTSALKLSLVYIGIVLMLINIISISIQTHRQHTQKTKPRIISKIMLMQSLGLSLGEIVIRGSAIRNEGIIYSLPLLYAINISLLWFYRETLFAKPDTKQTLDIRLSPKEQEIACAIAEDLSNKQIAARLNISSSTVKNHIYNMFKKCEVTNRVALIAQINTTQAPKNEH